MTKIAGSWVGSGSISQRHGSADPDPYQNFTDPQHCFQKVITTKEVTCGISGLQHIDGNLRGRGFSLLDHR
jgi:hypothetical protein